MSFLYPTFLFAAFAILVPIVIHFFHLKSHKTVYFSNIALLKKIKDESKVRSRLKHLVVLLLRILALLSLVFLFAQPIEQNTKTDYTQGQQKVAIYLDNSFSMEAQGKKGMLLDVAKSKVRSVVEAHDIGTVFTLTTNDLKLKNKTFVSGKQLIKNMSAVETSPASLPMTKILSALKKRFLSSETKNIYWISDFQKTTTNLDQVESDTTVNMRLVPLVAEQLGNVYVDSVWFQTPSHLLHTDENLFVRIVNHSENHYDEFPISVYINEAMRSASKVELKPNSNKVVNMGFSNRTAGLQNGTVRLEDYPITFDNEYHFSYRVAKSLSMLVVSPSDSISYFSALAQSADFLKIQQQSVGSINMSDIFSNDVLVLHEVENLSSGLIQNIKKYVEEGGVLLLFPRMKTDNTLSEQLAQIQQIALDTTRTDLHPKSLELPFFKNSVRTTQRMLQMPSVRKNVIFNSKVDQWERLLWDRHEHTILQRKNYGQGQVYLSSISLNEASTDLMFHPLFASVMLTIPVHALHENLNAYTIGEQQTASVYVKRKGEQKSLNLQQMGTDYSFIPSWHRIPSSSYLTIGQLQFIRQAGFYNLTTNTDTLSRLAFNYKRSESDQNCFQLAELDTHTANNAFKSWTLMDSSSGGVLQDQITELNTGGGFWRIFLLLAILFLSAEVLVIRFWK